MKKNRFIEVQQNFDYGADTDFGKGRQLIRCDLIRDVYIVLPERTAVAITFEGNNGENHTLFETFQSTPRAMGRFNEIKNILN